jgi:hypothetical protein
MYILLYMQFIILMTPQINMITHLFILTLSVSYIILCNYNSPPHSPKNVTENCVGIKIHGYDHLLFTSNYKMTSNALAV